MTMEDDGHEHVVEERSLAAPLRRDNQIARQDFAGTSLATQNGAIEAMVAKARSEVEAACILAKRWPRNMDEVRQDIMAECRRPGLAQAAIYKIPRGDKTIEGLSIRFAEVCLRAMGNLEASSETIYDDRSVRQVRVVVIDYERNSRYRKDITVNKTVERKFLKRGQVSLGERTNSFGDRVHIVEATEDDVTTKEASAISKAIRTGILRLVPGNLQDEAKKICKEIAAKEDAKDPAAARNKMFDAFASLGVKPSALEQWLGHSTDTISPAEREDLLGLHQAIKDGEISWSEALEERDSERKAATKGAPTTSAAAPAASPAREAKASDPPARQADAKPQDAPATKPSGPAAPPAKSSGKGTSALKGALSKPAAKAEDPREAEPGWMAGKDAAQPAASVELPPGTPPPRAGFEDRACAGCDAVVEVEVGSPAGQLCYACKAASRDAE